MSKPKWLLFIKYSIAKIYLYLIELFTNEENYLKILIIVKHK